MLNAVFVEISVISVRLNDFQHSPDGAPAVPDAISMNCMMNLSWAVAIHASQPRQGSSVSLDPILSIGLQSQ